MQTGDNEEAVSMTTEEHRKTLSTIGQQHHYKQIINYSKNGIFEIPGNN
jgi:hypothetical protein